MSRALLVCGGFLLAVLWFDLMFDVQALGSPAATLSEDVLASIAAYYRRVTTTADPMGRLVGVVMLLTVLGTALQLRNRAVPSLLRYTAFAAIAPPVALAIPWIVPNAVRLGTRADSIAVQSELARSILWGHVFCFASILCFCVVQAYVAGHARTSPPLSRVRLDPPLLRSESDGRQFP